MAWLVYILHPKALWYSRRKYCYQGTVPTKGTISQQLLLFWEGWGVGGDPGKNFLTVLLQGAIHLYKNKNVVFF